MSSFGISHRDKSDMDGAVSNIGEEGNAVVLCRKLSLSRAAEKTDDRLQEDSDDDSGEAIRGDLAAADWLGL